MSTADLVVPVNEARLLFPSGRRDTITMPPGITVAELLAQVPSDLHPLLRVYVNGTVVVDWDGLTLRDGDNVLLAVVPQGGQKGKGALGAILTIVISYFAPYAAGAIYSAAGGTLVAANAGMILSAIQVGVTMVGMMVVSALVKPASINSGTGAGVGSPQSYSLAGQSNGARPFGACFVVYGTHKVMPLLANNPDIHNVGFTSVLSALYDFGLGDVEVSQLRIGDVPIEQYRPELRLHRDSLCRDLTIAGQNVGYDQYAIAMQQGVPVYVRTKINTVWAWLDIVFPKGVFQALLEGGQAPMTADFRAWWRPVAGGAWTELPMDHYQGAERMGTYPEGAFMYFNVNDPVYGSIGRADLPYNPVTAIGDMAAADAQWRAANTQAVSGHAPLAWIHVGGFVFNNALYLQRYPDAAAAVAAGAYASGEDHFKRQGAWEGRDPYYNDDDPLAVRLRISWVGEFHIALIFQFETPGEYEIAVQRTDKIHDGTGADIQYTPWGKSAARYNESTVVLLKSGSAATPVLPRLRHTMLEMRVQATDQLQGVVQNLSAVCTSVLNTTTDGVTFTKQPTRNPAWIALDVLTSERNPKPLAYSQIDWPSWLHLAAICDTPRSWVVNGTPYTAPRFTCDVVVDQHMTVKELVESVLAGCRASLILTTAGKWGVLHDEAKDVPRQLLTPANSWGFSGSRAFVQLPHALHVGFINRDNAWQKDEVPVYADGYDASNATQFETLDTYGITDYAHAWAYGRYMLAQGLFRNEVFTLNQDVENLLVQRGDLVYVAHDVPMVGGVPTRLDAIDGARVHANIAVSVAPTGYCIRLADGSMRTGAVRLAEGDGWFELDDTSDMQPDDLIVLGEFARETQPYLVQSVTPGADLSAQLVLCRYVPGVYDADQGDLPPWDPGFGRDYITGTDLFVHDLIATQVLYYVHREPRVDVQLTWITSGSFLSHHTVVMLANDGRRTVLHDSLRPTALQHTFDALRDLQYFERPIVFEVTPINASGWHGTPGYVTITLKRDTDFPQPVESFGANVQSETIELFWTPAQEDDIASFALRYTPETVNPVWEGSQFLAAVAWPGTTLSVGARTGSYGIRVQDTSGNQSTVVWRRTTVATLPDINVITILNDRDLYPDPWPGLKSHVVVNDYSIQSEGEFGSIYPIGIYYFDSILDLGDVYEVRVSSKLQAHGEVEADVMAQWVPLSAVTTLASALTSVWTAFLEIRTSDAAAMMSEWPTLSVVDPIAAGDESVWSGWRPCNVGDYTAQLLQFRLVLQSFNPGVRVVVSSGRVEVDMPDRVDTYGDVNVSALGLDFVFPMPFRELQALAISINGNPDPVVATITGKSRTGFHVALKNTTTGSPVAGSIDIMAEGYGRERIASI